MGAAPHRPRLRFALPAAVALAAFVLYAVTACRTVFFGDAGELITAAASLGVAHPPGYPLYTALGHAALWLPVGEAAWRMNLLSALFGALTCGAAAGLVRDWTRSTAAGAAAGLLLAVSAGFWSAATVAEVYTLHLFLVAHLLLAARRAGEAESGAGRVRALLFAALIVGLGLSHRPTILLAVPAAAVLAWPSARGFRRWLRARSALAALGLVAAPPLLFYGTLMLRARSGPAVNWGRPDDLSALLAHVTARGYDFYVVGPAGWLRADAWERLRGLLWDGMGYGAPLLALLGLAAATAGRVAGPAGRRAGAALLLLALPVLLFGLSYGTEDVEVLFLPLCFCAAAAAGLGIGALGATLPRGGRITAPLLAGALVLVQLLVQLPARDLRRVTAAADYGRDLLATVSPRGVLFVAGDDSFLLAYLVQVLGERPDAKIYDELGLLFEDELREPGTAPQPGEPPLAYRARREREFVLRELSRPEGRRVFFTTWPGYDLPPGLRFEPVGLLYEARRAGEPPRDPVRLWSGYHERRVTEQALRLELPFARTLAAVYPLMRGERELWEGRRLSALEAFDRAARTAGASETIHNYLGTVYGRLGEYELAIREFEAALAAKPVSPRAWNNLGLARSLAGDREGAREAWRHSLELAPDQPDTREMLKRLED